MLLEIFIAIAYYYYCVEDQQKASYNKNTFTSIMLWMLIW